MARAQLDTSFNSMTVRVEGNETSQSITLLNYNYEEVGVARTGDPGDLRKLAKALNQLADFVEANRD